MEIIVITLKHPNPISAAECVENGEAWLDETKPDWDALVDLDTLNMESVNKCVAGQVFAEADLDIDNGYDYVYALLETETESRYGIEAYLTVSALGFSNGVAEFWDLDDAWREAITARRSS